MFSTPVQPILSESVPRQKDADRRPHLKGTHIAEIDAHVGLLIGHDVPKALEPKEVKESQRGGPYATRTLFGWPISGLLGRNGIYPKRGHTASGSGHDQLPHWCSYPVPTRMDRVYGRHRVHVLPSLCSSQRFGCPMLPVVAWE